MKTFFLIIAVVCFAQVATQAQTEQAFDINSFEVEYNGFAIEGIPAKVELRLKDAALQNAEKFEIKGIVNGEIRTLIFKDGRTDFAVSFDRTEPLSIKIGGFTHVQSVSPMPAWLSIIPPLIVILLALVFKEVLSSLAIGVISGAMLVAYYTPDSSVWAGLFRFIDHYIVDAFADPDHASVILFSMLIAATVALVSRNGGMAAVVELFSRRVKNARSAQLSTWLLGVAIFFDDYANTLVVGNTMRPITDRMRISREKLSFIVDSTAAPVAGVAFITTWIGAELGYIDDALARINAQGVVLDVGAYGVFLNSLQYAFYPFLCLGFILLIIYMNRDFGPMWKAENRARLGLGNEAETKTSPETEIHPEPGAPLRAINAALPIGILISVTAFGLIYSGYDAQVWQAPSVGFFQKLSSTIGQANSYQALLWASFLSLLAAIVLTVGQRIMSLTRALETSLDGFKTMVGAMSILILAWSLAQVTADLHTGEFLSFLISGNVAPWMLAPITFVLAGVVAFSTGTSWGTMAILYPLVLPLAWKLSLESGLGVEEAFAILTNCSASVLAGSLLGDHCSPISDTTILSSLASQCNHLDHVKTQLPYALAVGGVAIVLSVLVGAFSISGWWLYPLGFLLLYALIRLVGKPLPAPVN